MFSASTDRRLAFDERLARLSQNDQPLRGTGAHSAMRGRRYRSAPPRFRRVRWLGLTGVALVLGSAFLVKAVWMVRIGEAAYQERLLSMGAESLVEVVVGSILQPDPLTLAISKVLTSLLT